MNPKTEAQAVVQYRPFVLKMSQRFLSSGVPQDDLVQEGLLAVAVAFRAWRPDGGASFLTWIRRPVYYAMRSLAGKQRRMGGSLRGGSKGAAPVTFASMDAFLPEERFSEAQGNRASLHDVIGSFEEPGDPFTKQRLPDLVGTLEKRERQVLRLRYERGLTYAEVGARLKISRELARQIEQHALERLKAMMANGEEVES